MVYKTILLSLITFALYGQIMLNPNRANTLNPPAVGGGGALTIVYSDSVTCVDNCAAITFTHWGSIQADDLILLMLNCEDGQPIYSQSSDVSEAGYTFMYSGGLNGVLGIGGFSKVASGSESGTFTVTNQTTTETIGFYVVVRNANTTDPVDSIATVTTSTAATSIEVVGVQTANNNSLVICHGGYDGGDYTNLAYSAGWTLYSSHSAIPGNAFSNGGMWGYKYQVTAGATGNCTISNDLSDEWSGVVFSINPE